MKLRLLFTLILIAFFNAARASGTENLNDSIQIIVIQTSPKTSVQVKQLQHEFWFGSAISNGVFGERMSEENKKTYKEKFLENFNSAVTENVLG